jgi:hypothetical protein
MNIRCYVDEHGFPRAEVDSPYEPMGLLLISEIDRSLYNCSKLFSLIDHAKKLDVTSEWSGEAHLVTITRDTVVIENQFLIESADFEMSRTCEMPVAEFEKALTQWCNFIKVGQEDSLKWIESKRDDAELARIREQRIKRKLMESKKRRGA